MRPQRKVVRSRRSSGGWTTAMTPCEGATLPPPPPAPGSRDPDVVFLTHGSCGACPTPVLEAQRAWRDRLESEPVRFMVDEVGPAPGLGRARGAALLPPAPRRR